MESRDPQSAPPYALQWKHREKKATLIPTAVDFSFPPFSYFSFTTGNTLHFAYVLPRVLFNVPLLSFRAEVQLNTWMGPDDVGNDVSFFFSSQKTREKMKRPSAATARDLNRTHRAARVVLIL